MPDWILPVTLEKLRTEKLLLERDKATNCLTFRLLSLKIFQIVLAFLQDLQDRSSRFFDIFKIFKDSQRQFNMGC